MYINVKRACWSNCHTKTDHQTHVLHAVSVNTYHGVRKPTSFQLQFKFYSLTSNNTVSLMLVQYIFWYNHLKCTALGTYRHQKNQRLACSLTILLIIMMMRNIIFHINSKMLGPVLHYDMWYMHMCTRLSLESTQEPRRSVVSYLLNRNNLLYQNPKDLGIDAPFLKDLFFFMVGRT